MNAGSFALSSLFRCNRLWKYRNLNFVNENGSFLNFSILTKNDVICLHDFANHVFVVLVLSCSPSTPRENETSEKDDLSTLLIGPSEKTFLVGVIVYLLRS